MNEIVKLVKKYIKEHKEVGDEITALEVADAFQISYEDVRKALEKLKEEGWVV